MKDNRWLLLLHQIPPKPSYFRAQVLRRLGQVGALAVKNSAYLLPENDETQEDFQWICQEIERQGGAAWLFRAEALAGMSAEQIEEAFRQLREPDYEELAGAARELVDRGELDEREALAARAKLEQRLAQLTQIDFFECAGREPVEKLLEQLSARGANGLTAAADGAETGRTWVTRAGIRVDRIGSAWLIRRFIDPQATFRFVDAATYRHAAGEFRFDMYEGEYTHEGDECTFEVLLRRYSLHDAGLRAVAEMVHDIDLKDARYQRTETAGLARMLDGVCLPGASDEQRLERGGLLFEAIYQSFAS